AEAAPADATDHCRLERRGLAEVLDRLGLGRVDATAAGHQGQRLYQRSTIVIALALALELHVYHRRLQRRRLGILRQVGSGSVEGGRVEDLPGRVRPDRPRP